MTLSGHYSLCFKTRAPDVVFLFISFNIQTHFSRQMTADVITALTYRYLK